MRPLIGIHGVTPKEDLLTGETNRKALAPLESGFWISPDPKPLWNALPEPPARTIPHQGT